MKNTKRFSVLVIAVLIVCVIATALTACNPTDGNHYDPETRPFSMSISQPDGVFNPFFSTSAYDSSVISLTQIGMLNTDKEGKIVYGENEPTVVKDYTKIENKNDNGDVVTTTYEFLIKKGIKWSNGSDLTIKDVLFNLYVYLDPAYTGSATIYSTDIVGLKNYRLQTQDEISDGSVSNFESKFIAAANMRINDMIDYVQIYGKGVASGDKPTLRPGASPAKIAQDFAITARLFKEELTSDWNAINKDDYTDWGFTESWQIFLLNDGGYMGLLAKDSEGNYVRDEDDNYQLDPIAANDIWVGQVVSEGLVPLGLATIDDNDNVTLSQDSKAVNDAIKNYCIETVFSQFFPRFLERDINDGSLYQDPAAADIINRKDDAFKLTDAEVTKVSSSIITQTNAGQFETVARYWQTATTILEKYTADAKSEEFEKYGNSRPVPNITGITTRSNVTNFNEKNLGSEYDVLSITINGVDPKAIYNFAFNVAPMYYYSTTSWTNSKGVTKNYISEFDGVYNFGLEFGSSSFMNEVVNAAWKIGVPVGAGPYMASSETGKTDGVSGSEFMNNNMIYYIRNPYFYTVGEGLSNAKINTVRYKVVESDQIINALANGDIDFGDPSATKENIDAVEGAGLTHVEIDTSGYGYVGINPRFVPSVNVRRIIMSAMNNAQIVDNYYKGDLASTIVRPMSKTSWAYPKTATTYVSNQIGSLNFNYAYSTALNDTVKNILTAEGYSQVGGVWEKTIPGFGVDRLDYKFTIAGGSTDHPAYSMFLNAAQILNSYGFAVKVVTSQTALTDLSSGKLEVWAAAWSSTIDPDMYQVYHMESQASSVKNWGYSQILGQTCPDAWGDEYIIVEQLSKLIDEGRSTNSEDDRKAIYADALDLVMEMAVEFPTYQRKDMSAYQTDLLNPSTVPSKDECSPYSGLLARIWEINYL